MTPQIFFDLPLADLRTYYTHTFFRIKTTAAQPFRWVLALEFSAIGTPNNYCLHYHDENLIALPALPIRDVIWDFEIPATGAYNYRNTVVILTRNPVRQPTKGFAKSNTHMTNLMFEVKRAGGIPNEFYQAHDFKFAPKDLNLLFEDIEPLAFEKSLEKILKKQTMATTINSRISLSQGIMSAHPSIWLKTRLIGELNVKKGLIYPLHTAFVPELTNAFVDKGFIVKTL